MKLSVSLADEDVAFIDSYAGEHSIRSRSAVVHRALALLRSRELGDDYARAWDEWEHAGDGPAWDATVGDALGADAPG